MDRLSLSKVLLGKVVPQGVPNLTRFTADRADWLVVLRDEFDFGTCNSHEIEVGWSLEPLLDSFGLLNRDEATTSSLDDVLAHNARLT